MSVEQALWIGALASAARGSDPAWERELADIMEEMLRGYRPRARA
jgi:hypothetical protein